MNQGHFDLMANENVVNPFIIEFFSVHVKIRSTLKVTMLGNSSKLKNKFGEENRIYPVFGHDAIWRHR